VASDLDKLYLKYSTDPTMLDGLLEAVRGYAVRIAVSWNHRSPEDAAQEIVVKVWRSLAKFTRQSSFRTFVHTVAVNHLHDLASATKCRIEEVPTEDLPEHAHQEARCDRFPLDRFAEDERHLLSVFARHLHFGKAAAELGITPKALRSRLERLKTRQPSALLVPRQA
jgi:RNA polymerase sigma factor (sigma-70 family)